jgi:hypothetical protein
MLRRTILKLALGACIGWDAVWPDFKLDWAPKQEYGVFEMYMNNVLIGRFKNPIVTNSDDYTIEETFHVDGRVETRVWVNGQELETVL